MFRNRLAALFIICLINFQVKAQTVSDTLFINNGELILDTLLQLDLSYVAFNKTSTFQEQNDFISTLPSEALELTIVNNDSVAHTILFNKGQFSSGSISAGAATTMSVPAGPLGIYELCDSLERNRFLGLSTFIIRHTNLTNAFYWHLNEHQSMLNLKLRQGQSFDADTFQPDYFTINENTHPDIMMDSMATVNGHVGDSIYIFVFNSGKMAHAIHFHGYHVDIHFSDYNPAEVGRSKDSIPIYPRSAQIYLLVPFQPGIFPVHDHDLIATTGGGNYPNGMMVMMNIQP